MDTTTESPLRTGSDDFNLNALDIIIIIVYFIGILLVGLWLYATFEAAHFPIAIPVMFSREQITDVFIPPLSTASFRSSRSTLKGYFLAGGNMVWWPVGASLFASNIGSEHFIGLAGSGAAGGIAVGAFELNAMLVLFLLGWYFLPVYLSSKVYTMPEYLRKRYGGQRIRVYLAVLALLLSVLTKISVNMFAGALFVQQALGWNLYLSIILLLSITAVYTVIGGLAAVIYTDAAQTVIMLIGAFILMILSMNRVSWKELQLEYPQAIPADTLKWGNTTCGVPREDAFHMFRHPTESDLPWPGMVFGITVSAVWYWCTDQVIVQRALAAKSVAHAKGGCIFAAFLKTLPLFIIVIPGMISRVLFVDAVACIDPDVCMEICQNPTGCTNIAYPKLVINIMPTGLKGLMLAVVMSGLMSSLTSIFNSSSTIFTIDVWKRIRPNASETEMMVVGRVFILIMVAISILWIPIIQAAQGGRLFDYIQAITSYLAPPICAVFVLAVSWGRVNEKGAFWGLMFGLVLGLIRMVLDFANPAPQCGEEDTRPGIVANWHFLYFGIFLFGVVCIFTIIVSLLTDPLPDSYNKGLTYWARKEPLESKTESSQMQEVNKTGDAQEKQEDEEVTFGRKLTDWICGTGKTEYHEPTEEEIAALDKLSNLVESRMETIILNLAAVLMIASSIFLWAFFA